MNLFSLLAENASTHPDKPALLFGRCGSERQLTYRQVHELACMKAKDFGACGVRKGSNILVMIPMSAELYITLSALWHIGATALFIDPSASKEHIKDSCRLVPPDGLIGIPKAWLLNLRHACIRKIRHKHYWRLCKKHFQGNHPVTKHTEVSDATPAILTFTSGSTGKPKATIRTHGLLHAQHHALLTVLNTQEDECDLATMPVMTLINLASGITTLIPDADLARPGFINPTPVLEQIRRYRPTRTIASPAFLLRLHEHCATTEESLHSFRKVITGGAPVFPPTLGKLEKTFPDSELIIAYGSTEAEPISHMDWSAYSEQDRTLTRNGGGLLVGYAGKESTVMIIKDQWGAPVTSDNDEHLKQKQMPVGQCGEIIVSGDHVVSGYVNGQGDSENKIKTSDRVWHRTGDAGYFDEAGRLWLMGRCAASFEYKGKTVYPFALEAAAVQALKCEIAACIEINGTPHILIPQSYKNELPESLRVGAICVEHLHKADIPLDKRHNAKVNYAALKKRLSR